MSPRCYDTSTGESLTLYTTTDCDMARRMRLLGGMNERTFWHSDPDALLANAAQALDAKRAIGQLIGRDWAYVDDNLGAVLLTAVRMVPEREQRRRRDDRRLVSWVSRLIPEIPADDPYRPQVLRRLQQVL